MDPKDTYVILAAAGQSNRFRQSHEAYANANKVYLLLDGIPVWQHSVLQFRRLTKVGRILMTVAESEMEYLSSTNKNFFAEQNVSLVVGGSERWESVRNGIQAIEEEHMGDPSRWLVAVHDAARPCVRLGAIERVLETARNVGAATLGQPLWGTIKRVNAEMQIIETVSRERLYQATTPQVARLDWMQRAYSDANIRAASNSGPITDDACLLAFAGFPVNVVPDDSSNIKITTAEDLTFAESILSRSRSN